MFEIKTFISTNRDKPVNFNNFFNQTIRGKNQSPKVFSNKIRIVNKYKDSENNNENLSSKLKLQSCSLDINPKSYSKGPSFQKQYNKITKSVSDIFNNLKSKANKNLKLEEDEINELPALQNNERNNKEQKLKSNLLSNPAFLREFNKTGPTFLSPETINKVMNEQRRLLYSRVAEPQTNTKVLTHRYARSDVFNIEKFNPSEVPPKLKTTEKVDYLESDIFNQKNSKTTLAKTYDKVSNLHKNYTSITKSQSEWYPKTSKATLFNHESCEVRIISPAVRGLNKGKEKIMEEDKDFCTHKKKSISEYVDLVRSFSPNPNATFLNTFRENKNEFFKSREICTSYGTMFNTYKSVVDLPFSKKI